MSVQRLELVFVKKAVDLSYIHLLADRVDDEAVTAVLGIQDAFLSDLEGSLTFGKSHLAGYCHSDDLISAGILAAVHDLIDVSAVYAALFLHVGGAHALFREDRFDVRT